MTEPGVLAERIVDAHAHFWDRSVFEYSWLEGLGIDGPYTPFDLPSTAGGVPVSSCVFIEAACAPTQSAEELAWVAGMESDKKRRVSGMVGSAAIETNESVALIAKLVETRRVVGARRIIDNEADDFAIDLIEGVNTLHAAGLTFDVCCSYEQLDDVITLVDRCDSGCRIVLDHLGKPRVGDAESFDRWASRIAILASYPNVVCKLSGLMTEVVAGTEVTTNSVAPYLAHALESFSVDRTLFGSDWPVCTLGGTYEEWVSMVATALGSDRDAHQRVFADNALEFYGLDLEPAHTIAKGHVD